MLTPEIALLAAATALLLTLVNCLLVLAARRAMARQISELRIELDANLSASHQLARHVRELQRDGVQTARTAVDQLKEDDRYAPAARERARETNQESYRDQDSLSLADKLGLSQSEAEIVSHLKPRRSMGQMIRESA